MCESWESATTRPGNCLIVLADCDPLQVRRQQPTTCMYVSFCCISSSTKSPLWCGVAHLARHHIVLFDLARHHIGPAHLARHHMGVCGCRFAHRSLWRPGGCIWLYGGLYAASGTRAGGQHTPNLAIGVQATSYSLPVIQNHPQDVKQVTLNIVCINVVTDII